MWLWTNGKADETAASLRDHTHRLVIALNNPIHVHPFSAWLAFGKDLAYIGRLGSEFDEGKSVGLEQLEIAGLDVGGAHPLLWRMAHHAAGVAGFIKSHR